MRSALQNHLTILRVISQEMGMFLACPVFIRTGLACTNFAVAWPVNLATITSASLDNATLRDLESRSTKLDSGVTQYHLFSRVLVLHAVF